MEEEGRGGCGWRGRGTHGVRSQTDGHRSLLGEGEWLKGGDVPRGLGGREGAGGGRGAVKYLCSITVFSLEEGCARVHSGDEYSSVCWSFPCVFVAVLPRSEAEERRPKDDR